MDRRSPTRPVNGSAIREARQCEGLDAQEVADAVGISVSYLYRLETGGRRRMGSRAFAALAMVLGQPTDDSSPLLRPSSSPEKEVNA